MEPPKEEATPIAGEQLSGDKPGEDSNGAQIAAETTVTQPSLKGKRKSFTVEQLLALEYQYSQCKYLRSPIRQKFARILQLSDLQVKVWFQNRRAKDSRGNGGTGLKQTAMDRLPFPSYMPIESSSIMRPTDRAICDTMQARTRIESASYSMAEPSSSG